METFGEVCNAGATLNHLHVRNFSLHDILRYLDFVLQYNFLNFRRFTDRYSDRAGIMIRVAEMSANLLPKINEQFSKKELKTIELNLIKKNVTITNDEEVEFFVNVLKQFFPNLSEKEIA